MFEKTLESLYPRLLTQACRDVTSPFYGCFDRNWWHYRIRDFPSVMLQQGGYTAYLCSGVDRFTEHGQELRELAHASALFWNRRAAKRGAFEEYYPWERGYPPLAFSTLAMAKLLLEEVVYFEEIAKGLRKAARQLQRRFERQAGNQQVAGLAALAVIRKVRPALVNQQQFDRLKQKTLALQDEEGWFTEYDGPDLGYLSVTLDCLWDLYDVTGDRDYLVSAEKAFDFLHGFVMRRGGGAGMLNARNTDYIVPYGICRFVEHSDKGLQEKGRDLLTMLFSDTGSQDHFFSAIDDRYWSHYIGHSVVRAAQVLEKAGAGKRSQRKVSPGIVPEQDFSYEQAGYLFRDVGHKETKLLVAVRKGGVFSVFNSSGTMLSDYGWVARKGKKQYVNHWWSDSWKVEISGNSLEVKGNLFPHREKVSTPFLHFGLRVMSFLFGRLVTGLLRRILIFKDNGSSIRFSRRIDPAGDSIIVTDTIEGLGKKVILDRAPRASKRHVASADAWHREDFRLRTTEKPMETIMRKDRTAVITTTIML